VATILLAEDTADDREIIIRFLAKNNHVVLTARSGQAALDMLRDPRDEDPKIDIIIADINMPNLGGADLAKRIREEQILKVPPIIFVTAWSETKFGELRKQINDSDAKIMSKLQLSPEVLDQAIREMLEQ